jgi:hypothetical protein
VVSHWADLTPLGMDPTGDLIITADFREENLHCPLFWASLSLPFCLPRGACVPLFARSGLAFSVLLLHSRNRAREKLSTAA